MSEYGILTVELSANEKMRLEAESKRTRLPLDGILALEMTEAAIKRKRIDPAPLMSAQDHLQHIADEVEAHGVTEDNRFDLMAKLRILSNFATTALVPVEAYRSK